MTDLKMTKLCAQAMGWRPAGERKDFDTVKAIPVEQFPGAPHYQYAPLRDDAAVMALIKKYFISVNPNPEGPHEVVWFDPNSDDEIRVKSYDLNRAIVDCVAQMQAKVAA